MSGGMCFQLPPVLYTLRTRSLPQSIHAQDVFHPE
jgi:hypothetical protein